MESESRPTRSIGVERVKGARYSRGKAVLTRTVLSPEREHDSVLEQRAAQGHTGGTQNPPLVRGVLEHEHAPGVPSQRRLEAKRLFVPDLCLRPSAWRLLRGAATHRDIIPLAATEQVLVVCRKTEDAAALLVQGVVELWRHVLGGGHGLCHGC